MLYRIALVCACTCLVAACATKPEIYANHDPGSDFSAYKTFAYFDELGTDHENYSSLITQYLKDAVSNEMIARGYRLTSHEPDVEINFFLRAAEKTEVTSFPAPAMGYYAPRYGRYGYWAGYGYETHVSQYTEGTLTIHMVDNAKQQIVWEGTAVGRLKEESLQAPREPINEVVASIFARYSFTAP